MTITRNDVASKEASRRLDLAACVLLFLLTAFRLWYAGSHELLQDEAYYWQWSRHLDWGYYDNTPLAAPLIHFFVLLFGATSLGVRAGAVLCALVASIFIYLLGKRIFGPRVAFVALLLANFIPLFGAGSIIMTMDPPQLAIWSVALYVIWSAVKSAPGGRATGLWLLAGVLAGLAAMAKVYALLLMLAVLVFLAVSPDDRHWLRRWEPYGAAVVAFMVFAPFLWWTHTHQNAFWYHVGVMGSRSDEHDKPLKYFWRDIGDQALMLSPLLYLSYIYALFAEYRRGARERNSELLFAWAPAATVTVAIALLSMKAKVEANWPAAAYVSGVFLIAIVLVRMWESGSVGRRLWVVVGCGLATFLSVIAYFPQPLYAAFGLSRHLTDKSAHSAMKIDRTNELYGWSELGRRVQAESVAMERVALTPSPSPQPARSSLGRGENTPFVFGINYRMPSEAAFYMPGHPQTYSLFLNDRANEYMFWEDPTKLVGRDAVFINDSDNVEDHLDDLRAVFQRVEPQPPLEIHRDPPYGAYPIRTIQIIRCYGFKGYDVHRWQHGW
jgi:hypothetical protein